MRNLLSVAFDCISVKFQCDNVVIAYCSFYRSHCCLECTNDNVVLSL